MNDKQVLKKFISAGVTFIDEDTAYVEEEVVIGEGTVIYPNVSLRGKTVIGKNCKIDSNSIIENTTIGDGVSVTASVLRGVTVKDEATVGPFAFLRDNAVVGKKCRVGDYVELKNATLGDGTKVAHLTYIGDAVLGKDCNVGCGTVFANYDGKNKSFTTVGDRVFIGSNTNIVAPRTIGNDVFLAAGGTITQDIPDGAMVIARARETIKEGRAIVYKKLKGMKLE